jgi:hypothetical protein
MSAARHPLLCLNRPILVGAALLLLAGCATKPALHEREVLRARVFRIKGGARWATDVGMPWQTLNLETILPPGAVIETASSSYVDICFGKSPKRRRYLAGPRHSTYVREYDNMIRLWDSSRVRFERLWLLPSEVRSHPAEDFRLDLQIGHIYGIAPKLAEGSSYEIKFGPCTATIIGTVFDISADGVVKVLLGRVSVTYPGSPAPQTQTVLGLQEFDVRTGILMPLPDCD